jgi:hypothetical protein
MLKMITWLKQMMMKPLNNTHVHSDSVVEDHEHVFLLSSGNVEQQIQDFIKSENEFLKPEEEEIKNGESSFSSYGSHGDSQSIPYAFIKIESMQKTFSHEEKIVQDQFIMNTKLRYALLIIS